MTSINVRAIIVFCCLLATAVTAPAQRKSKAKPAPPTEPPLRGSNTREGASQASKAATVLNQIMAVPDKGMPSDLLAKAECVAVFPRVVKAGFILAGQGGRRVASCRTPSGWSAPAFLSSRAAASDSRLAARATDVVLLFMNEAECAACLSDRFELGGDASMPPGPDR